MIAPRHEWPELCLQRPWLASYPQSASPHLEYPAEPMGWLLEQAASRFPQRAGCQYYDQKLTYPELLLGARRFATTLQRAGVRPGDRVGVLMPNAPETIIGMFGTWLAGGVVVSLSPLMVAEEVAALVRTTNCKAVLTLDVLAPLLKQCASPLPELVVLSSLKDRLNRLERLGYAWIRFQRLGFSPPCRSIRTITWQEALDVTDRHTSWPKVVPESVALILPTGGTTSAPKAVMLTHRNLLSNAWQLVHWSGGVAGEETILSVLPFFHSYGLSTCVTSGMAIGATLVLHHRFRTDSVIRLIERHRPTLFPVVPAMLSALITQELRGRKRDLSSLKACISGGAPLPPQVAQEFSNLANCTVVEGYGLSEASPVTHVNPLDGTDVPGSIGLPLPDTDACVVDRETGARSLPYGEVGELVVRGPQVMQGYYNDPAATANAIRHGWLYTGDLATCDERGFFRIVDRKKDLIITSGFNVVPGDVEDVLRNYPGVRDVAVVGVPDEQRGEIVKAVLVMDRKHRFNAGDFDDYVHQHLAAYKRPRLIETQTEDLPRNFLGKLLRRELRDRPLVAKTT
jgi:long-chain acyl-CoA synthetase